MRPLAVACTAIHGIFDITEQFKEAHLSLPTVGKNVTMAEKYLQLPTDVAYIKHIRWFGPPNGTLISCKFGAEVKMWDPENALIVQARLQTPGSHLQAASEIPVDVEAFVVIICVCCLFASFLPSAVNGQSSPKLDQELQNLPPLRHISIYS